MADLNFDPKAWKDAKDAVDAYKKAVDRANKVTEENLSNWDKVSNAIAGISIQSFFKEIERSKEETKTFSDLLNLMKNSILDLNKEVYNIDIAKKLQETLIKSKDLNRNLSTIAPEFDNISDRALRMKLANAFKFGDVTEFIKDYGDEGVEAIKKIIEAQRGDIGQKNEILERVKQINDNTKQYHVEEERFYKEQYKKVFSINKMFDSLFKNLGEKLSLQKAVSTLTDFDDKLKDVSKKFGYSGKQFDQANVALGDLARNGARFGVTIEDAFASFEQMSDALRTTNITTVSEYVKNLQNIPKAYGIAREEVMALGGTLGFFGLSSEKTQKYFQLIAAQSKIYGVNVSKVAATINSALPKWKQLGFKGGEDSLARMSAQAEKLGIKVETILDIADKMQNLETTMESAANLNILGGTFANTDPFQLMSAAVQGGDAMQKMLLNLGQDIGSINKKGEFEINFVDRKRLKAASEAVGIGFDEYYNMLSQAKIKTEKITKANNAGIFFSGMKDDEKQMLLDYMSFNEKGEIQIKGLQGIDNINQLKSLTTLQIKERLNQTILDRQNIDKQNQENQSLKDSLGRFVNQFMNLFTHAEPLINKLTEWMSKLNQGFSDLGSFLTRTLGPSAPMVKTLIGFGTILALTFGPASLFKMVFGVGGIFAKTFGLIKDMAAGNGFFGSIKNFFSKKSTPSTGTSTGAGGTSSPGGKGFGAWLISAGDGFRLWGMYWKDILKGAATFAAAIALISIPLLGITYVLGKIGGEFTGGKLAAFGLSLGMMAIIFRNIDKISSGINLANVAKFSIALGMVGITLVGITALMSKFGGIMSGNQIISMFSSLGVVAASMVIIGKTSNLINTVDVAKFGLSAGILGAGIASFVFFINKAGGAASIENIGKSALSLVVVAGGLAAISNIAKNGINIAGIAKATLAMALIGPSLIPFGMAAQMFQTVKWEDLAKIGVSIVGLSLALAGLSFLAPEILIGSIALAAASVSLAIFGGGMFVVAKSFEELNKVNWKSVGEMSLSLFKLIPSLAMISIIGVPATIGLVSLGTGLWTFGKMIQSVPEIIKKLSSPLTELSKINFGFLINAGVGLLSLVPSLIAMSALGLVSGLINRTTDSIMKLAPSLKLISESSSENISKVSNSLGTLSFGMIKFSAAGFVSEKVKSASDSLWVLAKSLSTLSGVNVENVKVISDSFQYIKNALIDFSVIGKQSTEIIKSSESIGSFAENIGKFYSNIANIDGSKIINFGSALQYILPQMNMLSDIGKNFVGILFGAKSLDVIGTSLSNASKWISDISNINFGVLTGISKGITELSNSIYNFSNIKTTSLTNLESLSVSLMLIKDSIGGFSEKTKDAISVISQLINPITILQNINWGSIENSFSSLESLGSGLDKLSNISSSSLSKFSYFLEGFIKNLKEFGTIGKIDFSSLKSMEEILPSFSIISSSKINFENIDNFSKSINSFISNLTSVKSIDSSLFSSISTIIDNISPRIKSLIYIGENSSKIISGANSLQIIGQSLEKSSNGFVEASNINWENLSTMSIVLEKLGTSISNFSSNGIGSFIGIKLMNSTLSSLAQNLVNVSSPIFIAAQSIDYMAESIIKLNTAAKNIDTTSLGEIENLSNKIFAASNPSVSVVSNENAKNSNKSTEIQIKLKEPIEINLNLNGRLLQKVLLDDTKFLT